MSLTDPDRLFPAEPRLRELSRAIYASIASLPILSPYGHCDPAWFAKDVPFSNQAELFVIPDHYVFRMLVSQGALMAELGPPWWFFDSFEGIKRFREATTETCGFYYTAGFKDDTRAFCLIPARHDMARRSDAAYLARLVGTGRLREPDAYELAHDLTYGLVKSAYNL